MRRCVSLGVALSRTRCAKLDGDIPNFVSIIATRGIMESSGTCSDSRSHVMPPSVVSARSAPASTRQTIPAGRCIVRLVACRAQVRLRFGSCAKPTRRHIHVFGRSWRVVDARSCVGYAHFRLHTEPFAEQPTRSTSASAAPHPRERVASRRLIGMLGTAEGQFRTSSGVHSCVGGNRQPPKGTGSDACAAPAHCPGAESWVTAAYRALLMKTCNRFFAWVATALAVPRRGRRGPTCECACRFECGQRCLGDPGSLAQSSVGGESACDFMLRVRPASWV